MSGQSEQPEIAPECIDEILQILSWLEKPPPLPPRDEKLWREALKRAKQEAARQVPRAPSWKIPPPTKEDRRLRRQEVNRLAKGSAENIYRQLDSAHAEADKERRRQFHEHVGQLDILLTPIRGAIARLGIGPVHEILCRPFGVPRRQIGEVVDARADGGHQLLVWQWREYLPKMIHDLKRIKQTVLYRQKCREESPEGAGAESTPKPETREPEQEEAPKAVEDLPSRLWTRSYCPNCGLDGVEFVSFVEFEKRCKGMGKRGPRYDTVSKRVQRGKYWADAMGQVPWCKKCKQKAAEGRGVEQPVEAPHVHDYEPTREDQQNIQNWAEGCVKKVYKRFDRELLGDVTFEDNRPLELFQVACTAIMEALQRRDGDMTRDEAERIGSIAIQEDRNKDYKSRIVESKGSMNDGDGLDEDDYDDA